MRFRIKLVRTQVAQRTVRATDEEAAIDKVRTELAQPYGFLGQWETTAVEIQEIDAEPTVSNVGDVPSGGAMLLSVKDAAAQLGVSAGTMYQLLYSGEIEGVQVGRRRFVSRDALAAFVQAHTKSGF
jgi:excisionase family DNA binding protein